MTRSLRLALVVVCFGLCDVASAEPPVGMVRGESWDMYAIGSRLRGPLPQQAIDDVVWSRYRWADPYFTLFPPPGPMLTARQPVGHEIVPTGPNGYIYRPLFVSSTGLTVPSQIAVAPDLPLDETAIDRAVEHLRTGQPEAALAEVDAVIERTPRAGAALLVRATALFAMGEIAPAATALGEALDHTAAHDWGRPVAQHQLYFGTTNRHLAALRGVEWAVADRPDDAAARLLLGYHYAYLGFAAPATKHLQAAAGDLAYRPAAEKLLGIIGPPAPLAPASTGPREF